MSSSIGSVSNGPGQHDVDSRRPDGRADDRRRLVAVAVPLALGLGALALRLWGIKGGLPFPGNIDEVNNYVATAAQIPKFGPEPLLMANPSAYTYLCYLVFAALHGFGSGVSNAYAQDPGSLLLEARVISAVMGTLAVVLLYLLGNRAFTRLVGALAGLLMATAFLPVVYSHLSLNDAITLAPVTLSLIGAVGVLQRGKSLDYALGGLGAGLAAGTKYTAGYAIAAVVIAALCRARDDGARSTGAGIAVAGGAALAGFFATNPYALVDLPRLRQGLSLQDQVTSGSFLGETERSSTRYYAWSLTWGLGVLPLIAAVVGIIVLARSDWRLALVLGLPPALFGVVLAAKSVYFARYLLPAYPQLCLLAAYASWRCVNALGAWRPAARIPGVAVVALLLVGQSVIHVVHFDSVWTRTSTQSRGAAWVRAHIPSGSSVIVDQYMARWWPRTGGSPTLDVQPDAGLFGRGLWAVFTSRKVLDRAVVAGWCWVVASSYQAGRAAVDPGRLPGAADYYRELERRADLRFRASPFSSDARTSVASGPVDFQFDWSYDNYPLSYRTTGPILSIYRLRGCRPRATRRATRVAALG